MVLFIKVGVKIFSYIRIRF